LDKDDEGINGQPRLLVEQVENELFSIGPYHGALPGIFRQNDPKRGWLDKNEQAMVIVDIDPIYAAPRPH